MICLKLFPTDIYVREDCDIDNKKLGKIIFEKEKTEPPRNISNAGGWQSEKFLYKDERFSEILKVVEQCFQDTIYRQTNYKRGVYNAIDQMWANVNRYRDYNLTHAHGNYEWSFVYYIKTPKDSGKIVFIDPRIRRPERATTGFIENFNNPFTHDNWSAIPATGTMILFPGWLEHYVQFNTTQHPRISISGNIKMRST